MRAAVPLHSGAGVVCACQTLQTLSNTFHADFYPWWVKGAKWFRRLSSLLHRRRRGCIRQVPSIQTAVRGRCPWAIRSVPRLRSNLSLSPFCVTTGLLVPCTLLPVALPPSPIVNVFGGWTCLISRFKISLCLLPLFSLKIINQLRYPAHRCKLW